MYNIVSKVYYNFVYFFILWFPNSVLLCRCCRRRLYDWLKVAPYESRVSDEDDEEWDSSNGKLQRDNDNERRISLFCLIIFFIYLEILVMWCD